MSSVLEVQNLRTEFRMRHSKVVAVDDITFSVDQGECVGIVGESGCGKSTTDFRSCSSSQQRAPDRGSITLLGRDLSTLDDKEMRQFEGMRWRSSLRTHDVAQPDMTIGKQIAEGVLLHRDVSKAQADSVRSKS